MIRSVPLGPLDFVELLKRLPAGSRSAELPKRPPFGGRMADLNRRLPEGSRDMKIIRCNK
jgi:hypothetical protein